MTPAGTTTCHGDHGTAPATAGSPREATAVGAENTIAIDLLRHLDPEHLILYEGRRPGREDWERHCRQSSEYVLAATRDNGAARRVAGTLEFRIMAGASEDGGMLDRLYVDPRHRRRGIASRLLRAAIAFARERGLATLRETIPDVLVRDPGSGAWRPHLPAGEGWGGLRSLGATVNACAREGQPCAVAGAHRRRGAPREAGGWRCERIGVTLTLPLAPMALAATPRARSGPSSAALLDSLLEDLVDVAGVTLR